MKKIHCLILPLLLALASCVKLDLVAPAEQPVSADEPRVQITFDLSLPQLMAMTKSLGEAPVDEQGNSTIKTLHLAVFGSSGYLKEYVKASPVTFQGATTNYPETAGDDVTSNTKYKYTASLAISENTKRYVHFIANGPETLPYASMNTIIPDLLCTEGEDAYWQMIELPDGIKAKRDPDTGFYVGATPITGYVNGQEVTVGTGTGEFQIADETLAYFQDVKLLRNFARIEVEAESESNFEIYSFAVVNVPTSGSYAPFYRDTFVKDFQLKEYSDLSDKQGSDYYPGFLPEGAAFSKIIPTKEQFGRVETPNPSTGKIDVSFDKNEVGGTVLLAHDKVGESNQSDKKNTPFFMYERPAPTDADNATFVLIYGHFSDPETDDGDDSGDYFYKIDLMENKVYYPIYRNFRYKIGISKILKVGADTPAGAAASMGSGDVSSDLSTAKLTQISDGNARIAVDEMFHTLIHKYPHDGTQLTVKYQFVPDETDKDNNGVLVHNNDWAGTNNSPSVQTPVTIEVESGDVIESFSVAASDDPADGYRVITLTTKDPSSTSILTDRLRIGGTYFIEGQATEIYRYVTFTMLPVQQMTVECVPGKVRDVAGQEMAVNISIPKELPESMFPLVFSIESVELSLTPDNSRPNNNLPVIPGKTLVPSGTKQSFHYDKTLSYSDYQKLVSVSATSASTVTFPAYFLTNKKESASVVYVTNEYFSTAYDEFANYTLKYFSQGAFTTPTSEGAVDFSFHIDDAGTAGGALPERVYIKMEGLAPRGVAAVHGLTWDEDRQAYYYVPSSTTVQDLRGPTPTLKLATTDNTGIISVTLMADEYEDYTVDTKSAFSNVRFVTAANGTTQATSASAGIGKDVYFRFDYQNGKIVPVTVTLEGLEPAAGETRLESTGSGTYTFTASNTNAMQVLHLRTTALGGDVSVRIAARAYKTVDKVTLAREILNFQNLANATAFAQIGETATVSFKFQNSVVAPVTITLNGLTINSVPNGVLSSNGDGTMTYTPNNGTENAVHSFMVSTTTAGSDGYIYLSAEAYNDAQLKVTRQFLNFRNFSVTSGNAALGSGKSATFRFQYANETGAAKPITISLDGLSDLAISGTTYGTLTNNGDGTWTYTPTDTNVSRYHTFTVNTTTFASAGKVTLSGAPYETSSVNVNRKLVIVAGALHARNANGNGNPSNLSTGNNGTNVSLYASNSYTSALGSTRFNNQYYNSSEVTVELNENFADPNENTVVYFRYSYTGWFNTTYYYATATLGQLANATANNRLILRFNTTAP